jgi:hypothetical protein
MGGLGSGTKADGSSDSVWIGQMAEVLVMLLLVVRW